MNTTTKDGKPGKCAKTKGAGRHITHRHHWIGGWYGMFSNDDPRSGIYGKNKPRPKPKPKKNSRGIWKW